MVIHKMTADCADLKALERRILNSKKERQPVELLFFTVSIFLTLSLRQRAGNRFSISFQILFCSNRRIVRSRKAALMDAGHAIEFFRDCRH
jgi:hypothetical protein